MKKLGLLLCLLLTLVCVCLCTSCKKDEGPTIRFLNFKPEIAQKYKELAEIYYKESGVRVIVT